MNITFLMPCYCWAPSGGFRVVYEYANQLVSRGHVVTVIHPRKLAFPPPEEFTLSQRLRRLRLAMTEAVKEPTISWHKMDARVRLQFVADSSARHFPPADIVFATAWHTVASVLALPASKGAKCYLIQHYETFLGPADLVQATWRAPLRKVAVSRWLCQLAVDLKAGKITYIPNGIDHRHFRLVNPIAPRMPSAAMLVSGMCFKGSQDGVKALAKARESFPDLEVKLFGVSKNPWIPRGMTYYCNPAQELIGQIYNQSSIIVSSSLSEGFGLPPAEGAACGCAMVSTDSGGVRDFIEHGVTGLLSPPGDPEALASNICTLLADDDLRVRLARAGHERILQFTWSRSTDQMEAFLESALDGQPNSAETSSASRVVAGIS